MRKLFVIISISCVVFACSHKTTSSVSTTIKTESATVTNAQYEEGKIVYEAKCGSCHKLKNPTRGNMTQWEKWIDKMAPKAKLTEAEKAQVTDYVSVNAQTN